MSQLLTKDGRLVKKGGRLVKVTDPAKCDCCWPFSPCPPLPPFCTVKIDPGSIDLISNPQTTQGVQQMLTLTIDSIPFDGFFGYSKTFTPGGAASPVTVIVEVGSGASVASVTVSGTNLNWLVPGGVQSQPTGFPPKLMSFRFRGLDSTPPMGIPEICAGKAPFEFDAEEPDKPIGLIEDGRQVPGVNNEPWPFFGDFQKMTVTFQGRKANPLP